ncbi:MAG: M20/M25/M40 family metallo-hydrolase [Planctomycetota bacterium]
MVCHVRTAVLSLVLFAGTALATFGGLDGDTKPVAIVDGKEVAVPAIAMGDPAMVARILKEGKENNQVMQHLKHLTKDIGSRLTGSSRVETANKWCKSQYELWGLSGSHIEEWGTMATRFDRGPCFARIVLRDETKDDKGVVTKVDYKEQRVMEISSQSWTKGTDGLVRGPVIRMPKTDAEYAEVKDKLKGAWILVEAQPAVGQRGVRSRLSTSFEARAAARKKVADGEKLESIAIPERVIFDGVAGFLSTTRDERVWTGAVPGWRERKLEDMAPDVSVVIRMTDYDCINSRLTDGEPVEVEINLEHKLTAGPIPCYNTIAEIKGTEKPDEIVIISAHLDSWDGPGSQGCTDNGTGSSVTLEAARILASVGAKPKRTIRFINWTGEEQGLLGSHAYVAKHKEEILAKVSACFVDDGGTNYEGGLAAAENMVDYLAAATAPINNVFYSEIDKKFLNVNIRNTGKKADSHGSSDHASFNQVGVPGFFWDESGRADYSHGWHTQHDKYELGVEEYLKQSATCAAITAYNLACAPDLLPRVKKEEPAK